MINYNYIENNVEHVMVELTSKCNAMCLRCERNIDGKNVHPLLDVKDLTEELWDKFFTPHVIKNLKHVTFNGLYGDPIMNDNFILFLNKLLKYNSNIIIKIHTNGSIRSIDWWKELAITLNKFNEHFVVFAIDGLEDTHSIYRQKTLFKNIMDNSKSFIDNGGYAIWQMIIFEHNEHQLDECIKLSKDMNFKNFLLKGSPYDWLIRKVKSKENFTIENLHKKRKSEYVKYDDNIIIERLNNIKNKLDEYDTIDDYYKNTNVTCKWGSINMLFLLFNGEVWPCCWYPTGRYDYNFEKTDVYENSIKKYGYGFNNLNNYTLDEILKSKWYSEQLLKDVSDNKVKRCAECCGEISKDKFIEFHTDLKKIKQEYIINE